MDRAILKIISENKNYLAINKSSQIHSVKIKNKDELLKASVADLLIERDGDAISYSDKVEDGGLLNRLDYETSGVLIAAKNRKAWLRGREILLSGKIEKSYLALVEGQVKEGCELETFIGTPYRRAKKVKIYKSKPGKDARALEAKSEVNVVSYDKERDVSLVNLKIHVARRHQVRAHMGFLGYPLVGDLLYGSKRKLSDVFKGDLFETQRGFFLHAEGVKFFDDLSGEIFIAQAEIEEAVILEMHSSVSNSKL